MTLRPRDAADLLDAVQAALRDQTPLELVGGGTKRAIGRPITAEPLELGALSGIRLYEPDELVLSAGAATSLAEITALLAEQRQHLAFEPPDLSTLLGVTGTATLGGIIAGNLAGPRRVSAGAPRDHLLGFSGVSGRGAAFKAGGRVVKNVTGFDLSKLIAGSWGTLAALAEVTVKVLPLPETSASVIRYGLSAGPAVAAMAQALSSPHEVTGAAWLPAALAPLAGLERMDAVALRLEGPAPSVAYRAGALGGGIVLDQAASEALWQAIRDVRPLSHDRDRAVWKVGLPPASGARLLDALPEAIGFLDWGGGLVWLALPDDGDGGAARIRTALASSGGHATLIRGTRRLRETVKVFEPLAGPLGALTKRVKQSFDPEGVLNPGRMHQGI